MKKIVCMLVLSAIVLFGCFGGEEKKPENKVSINTNDVYTAPVNPSEYQANLYNYLSDALKKEEEDKIASLVAQNFVCDFFTLKNKESSLDVGGLTYLPQDRQEEFKTFASTYVYGNYSMIVKELGESELPVVSEIKEEEVVEGEYSYVVHVPANTELGVEAYSEERTYPGWEFTLSIAYEDSDVDVDTLKSKVVIRVLDIDGRLVVVAMN